MRNDQPANERAKSGTQLGARVEECVGQSTLMLGEGGGQDLRIGRISHGFAGAKQQAQTRQGGEGGDKAGHSGG